MQTRRALRKKHEQSKKLEGRAYSSFYRPSRSSSDDDDDDDDDFGAPSLAQQENVFASSNWSTPERTFGSPLKEKINAIIYSVGDVQKVSLRTIERVDPEFYKTLDAGLKRKVTNLLFRLKNPTPSPSVTPVFSSTPSNQRSEMSFTSRIAQYLPSGFDPSAVEIYKVNITNDNGDIRLNQFSYGGVSMILLPYPIEVNGSLYPGVEISTFGDYRDAREGKFRATLLQPTNEVVLQIPSVPRFSIDEQNQVFDANLEVTPAQAHKAVIEGHAVMRAEMDKKPHLRTRILVLQFPSFFTVGKNVFNPTSTDLLEKDFNAKNITYDFLGCQVQTNQTRISWLLHKVSDNTISVTKLASGEDSAADRLYQSFNRSLRIHPTSSTMPRAPFPQTSSLPSNARVPPPSQYPSVARMPSPNSLQMNEQALVPFDSPSVMEDIMAETGAIVVFEEDSKKRKSNTPVLSATDSKPFHVDIPGHHPLIVIKEPPKKKKADYFRRPNTISISRDDSDSDWDDL